MRRLVAAIREAVWRRRYVRARRRHYGGYVLATAAVALTLSGCLPGHYECARYDPVTHTSGC